MPNSEYYSIKNNNVSLLMVLLVVIGMVSAGIFFLPQLVESYFSYDLSSIVVSPALSLPTLPKSGDSIVANENQLNNFQLPQGIPLNVTESVFGRANPFAPL